MLKRTCLSLPAISLLILAGIILFLSSSCKQKGVTSLREARIDSLYLMRSSILADSLGQLSPDYYSRTIQNMQSFVEEYPKDSLSPFLLFDAASISRGSGKFQQANYLYRKVFDHYPGSERAPEALFLSAFTLENELRDLDQAREAYLLFLTRFPNHSLAPQVKTMIDNLGKSPEELIREFEKQQKTK